MNSAIEIHDTELTSVEQREATVTLSLIAYVHQTAGRPLIDPGSGWTQRMKIEFTQASCSGNAVDLPVSIIDGELKIDGIAYPNHIPLPLNATGDIALDLIIDAARELRVRAKCVTATLIGNATYVEEFPGTA